MTASEVAQAFSKGEFFLSHSIGVAERRGSPEAVSGFTAKNV